MWKPQKCERRMNKNTDGQVRSYSPTYTTGGGLTNCLDGWVEGGKLLVSLFNMGLSAHGHNVAVVVETT